MVPRALLCALAGKKGWAALPDPYRATWDGQGGSRPEGEQDATDIIVERITSPAFLAVHRGYT